MQSNKTSQNTRFNQVSCIFVVNLKRESETLLKKKKRGERIGKFGACRWAQ